MITTKTQANTIMGLLVFNEVKSPSTKEPITAIAKNNAVAKKVTEEIKVYTEEDHLNAVDDKVKETYAELKSHILTLGKDIEVRPKKMYIAFRRKQAFASIIFLRSKLKAYLNIQVNQIMRVQDTYEENTSAAFLCQGIGKMPSSIHNDNKEN